MNFRKYDTTIVFQTIQQFADWCNRMIETGTAGFNAEVQHDGTVEVCMTGAF